MNEISIDDKITNILNLLITHTKDLKLNWKHDFVKDNLNGDNVLYYTNLNNTTYVSIRRFNNDLETYLYIEVPSIFGKRNKWLTDRHIKISEHMQLANELISSIEDLTPDKKKNTIINKVLDKFYNTLKDI